MSQLSSSVLRRKLCLCLLVTFLVLSLLPGCAGPPKQASWKNATGAEQHERLMWQAMRNKDWANFERSVAPAFVGVDWTGKMFDRQTWVERWKEAAIADYSIGEITVQPGGPDLVISYVLMLPGTTANSDSGQRLRVVSIWQQVKSRLVLISSAMTPVQNN